MKRTEKHAKALQSASTTSIVDSKSGLQKTKQALNVQFLADQLFPFNPVQNQLKKIIHIATPISLINHSSLTLLFCQMSASHDADVECSAPCARVASPFASTSSVYCFVILSGALSLCKLILNPLLLVLKCRGSSLQTN